MSILNICDYNDEKENIYYKELQKCFGANTHIISVVFEKDKNPAELLMDGSEIGDYQEFDKKRKALEKKAFSDLAEIFDDLRW